MPDRDLRATLALQPQIGRTLELHVRSVIEAGSVPVETKMLCAAMAAAVNFCTPLLVEYRAAARSLGVPVDKLNDLWEFARSDRFTPPQRAALAAAVALSREPRGLPATVWMQLRSSYDDGQIAEILCTIGTLNYLSRVTNAIETQGDAS